MTEVLHPLTITGVPDLSAAMQRAYMYRGYHYSLSLFTSDELPSRLTGWNLTDPSEFISWRITRPKCASTAELFGHLPSYAQCIQPSPRKEVDNDDEDDDDDYDEDTLTQDVLSPLKKRQRKKLRESAGVKPKASKKRTAGPSTLKPKTSLPPVGRMKCLWGGDCTVRMAFDYTLDTIKDWKNHIASHLAEPNEPSEGSAGRCQKVKMVTCSWGDCDTKVEKGYLFKHIVTHEVRFKLLCPRGCEVAIRDDNLERHLRSCRLET